MKKLEELIDKWEDVYFEENNEGADPDVLLVLFITDLHDLAQAIRDGESIV